MDDLRFDDLTRILTSSPTRRTAFRTLASAALGGLIGAGGLRQAGANHGCRHGGVTCTRDDQCCTRGCLASGTCACDAANPCRRPRNRCQEVTCTSRGRCVTSDKAPGEPCGGGKVCSGGACACEPNPSCAAPLQVNPATCLCECPSVECGEGQVVDPNRCTCVQACPPDKGACRNDLGQTECCSNGSGGCCADFYVGTDTEFVGCRCTTDFGAGGCELGGQCCAYGFAAYGQCYCFPAGQGTCTLAGCQPGGECARYCCSGTCGLDTRCA